MPSKFVEVVGLLAVLNEHVGAKVGLLLRKSGPAAILRFVASRAINPVKRRPFWPLAHVCNEGIKGLPRGPHRDARAAVHRKLGVPGVLASLKHARPRAIGSALPAMSGVPVAVHLISDAATLRAELSSPIINAGLDGLEC